ncbi:MAG: hypothetical protein F6K17_40050 [Okeania sp. SIO3C4]|nr:hypothetical protein [Okeania sp. SIO3B3]NER08304.1 hypothetical protein [Okeania sp. SIO3C4]
MNGRSPLLTIELYHSEASGFDIISIGTAWRLIMYKDEIVEEIHRIREEYSRSFNHDLKAIFADLQKQQAESGMKVVD